MSYITELTTGVQKLDRWQRLGLATTCVTSVAPVVERFALKGTQFYFSQGLDLAWDAFSKQAVDVRAVSIRAGLEELPEMDCDDSHLPAYKVMIVLSILGAALDVILQPDSVHFTIGVCDMMASYYSGFDTLFELGPRGTQRIDPKNAPAAGKLESLMMNAQRCMIEELLEASSPSAYIGQMRAWANQLRAEVEDILPVYSGLLGWDLPRPTPKY